MARFSKIARKEAPQPARQSGRLSARMRQYEDYVKGLKSGEVGRLVPESGETPRGLALRISRAAKRINSKITTWVVDGAVYFEAR